MLQLQTPKNKRLYQNSLTEQLQQTQSSVSFWKGHNFYDFFFFLKLLTSMKARRETC